jgi:methyl-accepting chemotaxis protein
MLLISVGAYFALLAPLDAMDQETGVFREVERSVAALQVETNALAVTPLGEQYRALGAAQDRYAKALAAVGGVKVLVEASPEMAQAVDAVKKLGALSTQGLDTVKQALEDLFAATDAVSLNAQADTVSQVVAAAASGSVKNGQIIQYRLANLTTGIATLNQALSVTRDVVAAKDLVIREGVSTIKVRSTQIGLVGILVALIAALIFSGLTSRGLTNAFQSLGKTVALVGAGDLRLRTNSTRKDELGILGRDIDNFLTTLTQAFRRIQQASSENLEVKDLLAASVASATSSAVQIGANSESILGQLQRSDETIRGSQEDLRQAVKLLEAFLVRLKGQNAEVGEAHRAVADLAEGIALVSELSSKNREAVEGLLTEADRGQEVFVRSFTKVAEINESVSAIQDLIGAIAEIAGQTNILALNAAIEAAHAGEAGKGFAVVADEIAKLAGASAATSGQIAATIQEVVAKIQEAHGTREETLAAFAAIGSQIARVSDQGRGIYDATKKMDQRNQRIREVMEIVTSNSDQTTEEAGRIGTAVAQLEETLGQVGRISHEVVSNVGEISLGLNEISRTVTEVAEQAERLGRVGTTLDASVNAFQTSSEEEVSSLS